MRAKDLELYTSPEGYTLRDGVQWYTQVHGQYGLWMPSTPQTGYLAREFRGRILACANNMPGVWCTDAMIAIRYYEDRGRQEEIDTNRRQRVDALRKHLFGQE